MTTVRALLPATGLLVLGLAAKVWSLWSLWSLWPLLALLALWSLLALAGRDVFRCTMTLPGWCYPAHAALLTMRIGIIRASPHHKRPRGLTADRLESAWFHNRERCHQAMRS